MDHRHGSWGCHMTVRTPVVEREQTRQHCEADEDHREPQLRNADAAKAQCWNIKRSSGVGKLEPTGCHFKVREIEAVGGCGGIIKRLPQDCQIVGGR